MPIIKLTFASRKEKKYTTAFTPELQALIESYQKPEMPPGVEFHLPKAKNNLINVTVQKNIFPPLNKPINVFISLKLYDFDNEEGQRVIGANFFCNAVMGDNYTPSQKINLPH